MNKLQIWLMKRYCPDFEKDMPEDESGYWEAKVIVGEGYWKNRYKTVALKIVEGRLDAYLTARWLALKTQWKRPGFIYSCDIYYGVKKL